MEHVLVEKLVNLRQYPVSLRFELPVDLSMASQPEVRAAVTDVRKILRSDGLLLQGTLVQTIRDRTDGNAAVQEESLHFTYLIAQGDLLEPNLLNFEVEVTLEQFHYHLMRKRGQVFLHEMAELVIILQEYHLEDSSVYRLGGVKKQSGFFLHQLGEVEKSFLQLVPIQLPGDYSLLIKISGMVEQVNAELTETGCILEFACHIQGEYVTVEQKVSTFFFHKNEYLFFPLEKEWSVPTCKVKPLIKLADLTLEENRELTILYHTLLQFYEEQEMDFYTGNPAEMPPGVEFKSIEVEQIGGRIAESQVVEEQIDLSHLSVEQLTHVRGECADLTVEEIQEQLLVSGIIEWNCTYFDRDGRERIYRWTRQVEQMIAHSPGTGHWQVKVRVRVPEWDVKDVKLCFTGLIEYSATGKQKRVMPVLTRVPPELQEANQECFLVMEEIDVGQISVPGEEKVYLHRYATDVLQVSGQVNHWQSRLVEGGWMVKGQGELVIYYLTKEGERHCSHPFRFYQYIPLKGSRMGSELRLEPEVRLFDQELLEDGSVVQIRYLLHLHYALYAECQQQLITGFGPGAGRVRPVFQAGSEERIEEQIDLTGEWAFPLQRVREIEDVQLDWRDYRVILEGESFRLQGELEIEIRYRNRLGREKRKTFLVPVEVKKKVAFAEVCQQVRVLPMIKGFDYRLTDHPEIALAVSLELSYRVIGTFTTL